MVVSSEIPEKLNIGAILRHYKGGLYEFVSRATLESTGEEVAVYCNYFTGKKWVRPMKEMFDYVKYRTPNPTGQTFRFQVVENLFDN